MSVYVMSAAWKYGPADRSDLLVLLAIADFADDDGYCWPSMKSLAEKARMTERGAQKIIRRLEEHGFVSVSTGSGRKNCNEYQINLGALQKGEQETPNTVHPERRSPRTGEHKPRTGVQETPNGGSPEPSRTIIEPSENPLGFPQPEILPIGEAAEKPPPKARLPDDWALSDEGWAYARSQAIPDEVIEDEARGFHAYWTDRRDRDASKSARGWEQCWAGWCRRIAGRYRQAQGVSRQPFPQGGGRGGGIASIAARRRASGAV